MRRAEGRREDAEPTRRAEERAERETPRRTSAAVRLQGTLGNRIAASPRQLRRGDAGAEAPLQLRRGESGAEASRGARGPLEVGVRRSFEGPFGADFSTVRVHEDPGVRRLGALAYTRGEQIWFAPGLYRPDTAAGARLLGHELTHVLQQRAGRVDAPQGKGAPINGDAALEREADEAGDLAARGERVHVEGATAPPSAAEGPIQRKVGFEIEVGSCEVATVAPFRRDAEDLLDPIERGYTKPTEIRGRDHLVSGELLPTLKPKSFKFIAMRKKDPLLFGDGFVAEADESNSGGKTNLEFVTEALPDTLAGALRLSTILRKITALVDTLGALGKTLKRKESRSGDSGQYVMADELAEHGTPVHGVILIPGPSFDGVIQVTTGILLDQVIELMTSMAGPQAEEKELFQERMYGRAVLGGAISGHLPTNSPTAMGPGDAMAAISEYKRRSDIDSRCALQQRIVNKQPTSYYHRSESTFGSPELAGLLALLIQYTRTANQALGGYAKTIAPLMARTDFAKMFAMLPPLEQQMLGGYNAHYFVELVSLAVGENIDIYAPVFEKGLYHNYKHDPRIKSDALQGLTREEWYRGIAQGIDRLTAKNFNQESYEPTGDLESLGSFGSKTEKVGASREDAPIFEIRSIGVMGYHLWYSRVMDIFRFICGLNNRSGAPYRDTVTEWLSTEQQPHLHDPKRRDDVRDMLKIRLEGELKELLG